MFLKINEQLVKIYEKNGQDIEYVINETLGYIIDLAADIDFNFNMNGKTLEVEISDDTSEQLLLSFPNHQSNMVAELLLFYNMIMGFQLWTKIYIIIFC